MKNTSFRVFGFVSTLLLAVLPAFAESDPHSYAQPEKILTKHIDLDLNVDLEKRTLGGTATLTLNRIDSSASLILDTMDLKIISVQAVDSKKPVDLNYVVGPKDEILGQKMEIVFPAGSKATKVKITYEASTESPSLVWNTAEQTASHKPFLSTNSEPIGSRAWFPCQDTPVVRASYKAKINVAQKDLMAVMSANGNPSKTNSKGEYKFNMDIPVPSYLIALAVGRLDFKSTGNRTGVYAEPEVVNAAAEEFSDTEKMLAAAESLYGKYVWGRYDLLVLPPSFAWGGMENPKLTFVTPTLITGKKDLVDVVAHEIAHSWSGNLVTNSQWSDLWINEGFTTYVQYRIIEQLHGTDTRLRDMALDKIALENELKQSDVVSDDTRLKTDFKGRSPDDTFTEVPYIKGALFLYTIEEKVGKAKFDAFLKNYFASHTFKSITTAEVESELSKLVDKEFVAEWIHKPGLPKSVAAIDSSIIKRMNGYVDGFKLVGSVPTKKDMPSLTSKDICYFLQSIAQKQNPSKYKLDTLDQAFGFSNTPDPEVRTLWYKIALKKDYEPAMKTAPDFLSRVGRGKFVVPVYEALLETKSGKKLAKETFEKNKTFYSPLVKGRVEKKLAKAK